MLVRRHRPSMRSVILAALVALAAPAICQAERQRIDLNGPWQFRTDPQNQGERDGWHSAGAVVRPHDRRARLVAGAGRRRAARLHASRLRRARVVPANRGHPGELARPVDHTTHRRRASLHDGVPQRQETRRTSRIQLAVLVRRHRRRAAGRGQRDRHPHRKSRRRAAGRPSRTETGLSRPAC